MTRRTRYLIITLVVLATITAGWWGMPMLADGIRTMHGG
jgi:hypothetical protein